METRKIKDNLKIILDDASNLSLNQIRRLLTDMSSSEIAHALESSPPKQRNLLFSLLKTDEEGDVLFDKSSFKIYVDNNSFEFLKGSEVDFVSTGLNQGIIFNNPNAKVTCGCGESFSI